MAASISGASLVITEGEDHFAPRGAPQKATPHIIDFLKWTPRVVLKPIGDILPVEPDRIYHDGETGSANGGGTN